MATAVGVGPRLIAVRQITLGGYAYRHFVDLFRGELRRELSRRRFLGCFSARIRLFVIVGFAAAGFFAHSLFLINLARSEAAAGMNVTPLSSWFDWCLLGAWLLAAVYLALLVRRADNAVGVFLLPLVLGLIGVSWLLRDQPHFPRDEALGYWRSIHGFALLFGTVAVTLGFVAGLMYLAQSYRLKHKLPPRPGFRLPSLEWLQRCNQWMLLVSTRFAGRRAGGGDRDERGPAGRVGGVDGPGRAVVERALRLVGRGVAVRDLLQTGAARA